MTGQGEVEPEDSIGISFLLSLFSTAHTAHPLALPLHKGARPIIRNPEKLLTLLWSSTLTPAIIPVEEITSTLLIT
jgi:hypothetical protein